VGANVPNQGILRARGVSAGHGPTHDLPGKTVGREGYASIVACPPAGLDVAPAITRKPANGRRRERHVSKRRGYAQNAANLLSQTIPFARSILKSSIATIKKPGAAFRARRALIDHLQGKMVLEIATGAKKFKD
jgi:hypothetical protein